jgi:murein DD-endopeptidase MepM/ murein hydrolase activator NlpD
MRWVTPFQKILILIFLATSVGCSTLSLPDPVSSGRLGFLDRLGDGAPSLEEGGDGHNIAYRRSPRGGWVAKLGEDSQFTIQRKGVQAPRVEDPFDLKWPLQSVQVTSPFGKRGGDFHEGIDLRARIGTPVYAAQAGVVLYSNSKIRGYGKMIVIKHDGKVATIYAHNSKLLVRRGQHVKKGQKISISGNTGHSSGPHLHFEIRRGLYAVNPLEVLPRPEVAQAPSVRRRTRPALVASSK